MDWKVHLAEPDIGEEEKEAISKVLADGWLTMGERTAEFERIFAKQHNVSHAIAVSNCTAALHLALQAVGIKDGDEVICPSLSFVATANAIIYNGAKPVFADIISPDNPTVSPEDIRRKITQGTRAIIPMHYGGYPCNIEEISEIGREHGIVIIEDAAHAPLVMRGEKMLGTFGSAGCFSFYANKNITTAEGGMVVTDNDNFAETIRRNRCHGLSALAHERFTAGTVGYDVIGLGYNYRIDEIRAAIGIVQLRKYPRNHSRRRQIVDIYLKNLCDVDGITIPFSGYQGDSAFHIFSVLLGNDISRKAVIGKMTGCGIQVSNHYTPIHLFSYYREKFGTGEGILPVTEDYGRCQLTLPLHSGMTDEDVEYVSTSLKDAISVRAG